MTLIPHSLSEDYLLRASRADEEARERHAELMQRYEGRETASGTPPDAPRPPLRPVGDDEGGNPLRPRTLAEVVGQERLKPLMRRLIVGAQSAGQPLDHLLFVGASGTGKTTFSTVIAREMGTRVFALKAPLDLDILMRLRESARDRDVIFVDEIHNQVAGDRRGLTSACDPEAYYQLLEDGRLASPTGSLSFPRVTWIGATTDVGLLPEPLSNRFPIQPRLAAYSADDMAEIAARNAKALKLFCEHGVTTMFANASRGIPRQVNNYMRAAKQLSSGGIVNRELAREVIEDLCSTTLDGLTASMQAVLCYLRKYSRRETREGVVYKASVGALATASGHGRDTKAIALLVEPALIQMGFLAITPGGRQLTDAGIERADALIARTT